jgi:hypothetical protein
MPEKPGIVTRLPVQHPKAPHCPQCKGPMPTFDGMSITYGAQEVPVEILAVTMLVRCTCGAEWALTKKMK